MLDIDFIRSHADEVRSAARRKRFDPEVVDRLLAVDGARRAAISRVCPPPPTVQSTHVWPGCGSSRLSVSAGSTLA